MHNCTPQLPMSFLHWLKYPRVWYFKGISTNNQLRTAMKVNLPLHSSTLLRAVHTAWTCAYLRGRVSVRSVCCDKTHWKQWRCSHCMCMSAHVHIAPLHRECERPVTVSLHLWAVSTVCCFHHRFFTLWHVDHVELWRPVHSCGREGSGSQAEHC